MNTKKPTVRSQNVYPTKKVVNAIIELPIEYQLIEKVGQGSFGEIFKIYDTNTHSLHACKVEFKDARANNQQPLLIKEFRVYQALKDISAVPQPYQLIQQQDYNLMTMPFFGLGNLEELRKKSTNGKFTQHCIMRIAYELIWALEQVHERKYIHRDIKPENFLVGSMGDQHNLYMIDYGLAKQYVDLNGQHIGKSENKGMVGTARYTSINSHQGSEQSRRDDLEAICYVLLYLYHGQLPWQNFNCATRQEKFQKILEQKEKFSNRLLEIEIPAQLREIYDHSRQLKFDEEPNYHKLKELCKQGFNGERYYCYDWCPDDCRIRPYDDHHDMISELASEVPFKKLNKTNTTTDFVSNHNRKQNKIDQIQEEDEESISEFPQIQTINQFQQNIRKKK